MLLEHRICSQCNKKVIMVSESLGPCLCQKHVQQKCCMSCTTDLWGRSTHCNTIVPMIQRFEDGKRKFYCQSHWKTKQFTCKVCNERATYIAYDDYGYCNNHKPSIEERNQCILEAVPYPVVNYITKLVDV